MAFAGASASMAIAGASASTAFATPIAAGAARGHALRPRANAVTSRRPTALPAAPAYVQRRGAATMVFGRAPRSGVAESSVPPEDAECACGSGRTYGRCCRPVHVMSRTPRMAEELLRARYSAYAYRLPTFIMRTTHRAARDLDRRKWRAEIDDFCRRYRFDGGVDVLEESMTGPDGCTIVFRANMLERGAPTSFVELSKFTRDEGLWYYVDGKLVDFYEDEESSL